jgi:hypothetical protein
MEQNPTSDKQGQSQKPLLTEYREGSLVGCNTPLRNQQQSDYFEQEAANAKSPSRLYKLGSAYITSTHQLHRDSSEYKDYLCEYVYGDSRWSITIKARSFSDARARLKALASGEVSGELHAVIPAEFGWWVKFYTWFRNRLDVLRRSLGGGL